MVHSASGASLSTTELAEEMVEAAVPTDLPTNALGQPLSIFTNGNLLLPYTCLSMIDWLTVMHKMTKNPQPHPNRIRVNTVEPCPEDRFPNRNRNRNRLQPYFQK